MLINSQKIVSVRDTILKGKIDSRSLQGCSNVRRELVWTRGKVRPLRNPGPTPLHEGRISSWSDCSPLLQKIRSYYFHIFDLTWANINSFQKNRDLQVRCIFYRFVNFFSKEHWSIYILPFSRPSLFFLIEPRIDVCAKDGGCRQTLPNLEPGASTLFYTRRNSQRLALRKKFLLLLLLQKQLLKIL